MSGMIFLKDLDFEGNNSYSYINPKMCHDHEPVKEQFHELYICTYILAEA